MLRQDDYQKAQLVTIGWRCGQEYGGHLAGCMVMSVLANRVRAGWGSWLEVLDRIPAFSAELEQPTGTPDIREPNFVRILQEVDAIYDGSKTYAKDAYYWADTRRIETSFFKEKILHKPEHKIVGNMNTLTLWG